MTEILMKGVELPKGEDVIELTIDSDGCIIFYDGHGKIEQYVEVIQPHGRLIDADELLKTVEELRDEPRLTYTQFSDGVLKNIQSAPTILEATE